LKTKHGGETNTMDGGGSFRKQNNGKGMDPYFNVLKRSHIT